jgi:hypothetical protein
LVLGIRMPGLGIALVVLAISASACVRAKAATVPVGPPLTMPEPPPRVLIPTEEEPLVSLPAGTSITTTPDIPPKPQPRTQKPEPSAPPATAAATPPPAAPAVENPRALALAPSAGEVAQDERRVREKVEKVQRDLKSIPTQRLSGQRQENYREAQRYLKQASDALSERNLVQANAAADKAAALVADMLPR